MKWNKAVQKNENIFDLPGNWIHLHYFEALNVLFRLENSLRIFVYVILKDNYQDKWLDISITSDDENNSTIGSIAKKRIAQDKNFAYLGYSTNNPLMYLTSGELIRLITSDGYWRIFNSYFLGSREIMKNKLDEIGNVRNSLAHFRPIKEGDVELIKQNAEHTLVNIEKHISQLTLCQDIVPTNTIDEWYSQLRIIGNEYLKLRFQQSMDKQWIKIDIDFDPPVLESTKIYSSRYTFRTLRLNTTSLLTEFSEFNKYVVIAYENIPYLSFDIEKPSFPKSISFILSRRCLQKSIVEIKKELETMITKITEEVDLIKEDTLARGTIIEGVVIGAVLRESGASKYWSCDKEKLKTQESESSLSEYWGNLSSLGSNFISDAETFPWMRTKISDDKSALPF